MQGEQAGSRASVFNHEAALPAPQDVLIHQLLKRHVGLDRGVVAIHGLGYAVAGQ